eukprot:10425510-Alexandrium_andersonii.AAC.1
MLCKTRRGRGRGEVRATTLDHQHAQTPRRAHCRAQLARAQRHSSCLAAKQLWFGFGQGG